MSGAVAVGSLVVVIELGAPVASNLGLGVGLPSVGHGISSQALQNPNFPTLGTSTTSVVGTPPPPAPAVSSPRSTQVVASDVSTVASSVTSPASGATPATIGAVLSSHLVSPAAATATPSASSEDAGAQALVIQHSQTTGGTVQGQGNLQSQGGQPGAHAAANAHGQGGQQGQGGGQHGNGNHGGSH